MASARQLSVISVTGVLLTFAAWAWGGVVLWAQWFVAGLGLLTLAISLLPVTDPASGKALGLVRIHDVYQAGLV